MHASKNKQIVNHFGYGIDKEIARDQEFGEKEWLITPHCNNSDNYRFTKKKIKFWYLIVCLFNYYKFLWETIFLKTIYNWADSLYIL